MMHGVRRWCMVVLLGALVVGCPTERIADPTFERPSGAILFAVTGTTDSTLDVVIGWTEPSSARPIAAYAWELLGAINAAPPDSLLVADTVPATQLVDSATIRRTLPGDTLFVRAGVRARNDRGTWGGQGQSPIIRVVIEDRGPDPPIVDIDTLPVMQVILRSADPRCLKDSCAIVAGEAPVQFCAILLLSGGYSGLATGSPLGCEDVYTRWLGEGSS